MYIDKLNQAMLRHAMMASRKRYFIRDNGSVNEKEFADWNRDFIHVSGSGLGEDSIREVNIGAIDSLIPNLLSQKIEEIKETSGNRDFFPGQHQRRRHGGQRHCRSAGGGQQALP